MSIWLRLPSQEGNTDNSQSYVFDHDPRFFSGFHLDSSWSMCTASWTLLVMTALGISLSAYYLPAENDYELIPEMDIEPDDQYALPIRKPSPYPRSNSNETLIDSSPASQPGITATSTSASNTQTSPPSAIRT